MTQGEMTLLAGAVLAGAGLVLLLTGTVYYGIRKRQIKKKLYKKYGF